MCIHTWDEFEVHDDPRRMIFMGMGICSGRRVCMSVGYHADYAIKKALQFERASGGVVKFDKVNTVIVGDLEPMSSTSRELLEQALPEFFANIPE